VPSPIGQLDIPATIVIGGGGASRVGQLAARLGVSRVLVVTDPGVVALGIAPQCESHLRQAGIDAIRFDGVQPDPTVANVMAGLERFQSERCDGIVAVGGGSPIDAAKAIGILSTNPAPLSKYQGYHQIPRAGAPVIAVPTTAGTGSEATKVTVITDEQRNVKMMLLDAYLAVRTAIVDYELSLSMPPALTAAVGVDTLTHGIEAYVSRKAFGMTDTIALSCVRLVGQFLRRAYHDGTDRQAREGMMLAAFQGGMAFANASVALVHGMSRPLGAVFHIPHGLSNAMLLPAVTRFSVQSALPRYATVARALGCATHDAADREAADLLLTALDDLNRELAITRLQNYPAVTRERFDQLVEKMAHDALESGSPQNNPRVPATSEIVDLYRQSW